MVLVQGGGGGHGGGSDRVGGYSDADDVLMDSPSGLSLELTWRIAGADVAYRWS